MATGVEVEAAAVGLRGVTIAWYVFSTRDGGVAPATNPESSSVNLFKAAVGGGVAGVTGETGEDLGDG